MFDKIIEKITVLTSGPTSSAAVQKKGELMVSMIELVRKGGATDDEWCGAIKGVDPKTLRASPEQMKEIRATTAEYSEKLHKLMNIEEKLEAVKSKPEQLHSGKTPPGIKPYAAPWDFCLLG